VQIFALSHIPEQAAVWQCNKHATKLGLEAVQIASTGLSRVRGFASRRLPAPTHEGTKLWRWCIATRSNFTWLCDHAEALFNEYTFRYGKIHKSACMVKRLRLHADKIDDGPLTPFVQAFPEIYQRDDPVEGYRDYYAAEKFGFSAYTKRMPPPWLVQRQRRLASVRSTRHTTS